MPDIRAPIKGIPADAQVDIILRYPTEQLDAQGIPAPEYHLRSMNGGSAWVDVATNLAPNVPASGPGDPYPTEPVEVQLTVNAAGRIRTGTMWVLPVMDLQSGLFDLSKPVAPRGWVAPASLENLIDGTTQARDEAQAAAASATQATTSLAAERIAVQQALAETAQNQVNNNAQQLANNAQAAAAGNKIPSASVAAIPATAGLYYITGVTDAGQVWERAAGGGLIRRPELEAISLPATVYRVSAVAGLRAAPSAVRLSGQRVTLTGYATLADGGQGEFIWRDTATQGARPAEADGIIIHHASDTSGWWERLDQRTPRTEWAGLTPQSGAQVTLDTMNRMLAAGRGLRVGPGVYSISGYLTIPYGTPEFIGVGKGRTVIVNRAGGNPVVLALNLRECRISNFTFDNSQVTHTFGFTNSALTVRDCQDVAFEDLELIGPAFDGSNERGDGLFIDSNTQTGGGNARLTFRRITSSGASRNGVAVCQGEEISFDDCTFDGLINANATFDIEPYGPHVTKNITLRNSRVVKGRIQIQSDLTQASNIVLDNCELGGDLVVANRIEGFEMRGGSVVGVGNALWATVKGGVAASNGPKVKLSGVKLSTASTTTVSLSCQEAILEDCEILAGTQYGVRDTGADARITVRGGRITRATGNAAATVGLSANYARRVELVGVDVSGHGSHGAVLGEASTNGIQEIDVQGGRYAGNGGLGLIVRGAARVTLRPGLVGGNGSHGAQITGCLSLTANGATYVDNNGRGLDFTAFSSTHSINNVRVEGNLFLDSHAAGNQAQTEAVGVNAVGGGSGAITNFVVGPNTYNNLKNGKGVYLNATAGLSAFRVLDGQGLEDGWVRGTTAQRTTAGARYPGLRYFDTTLNREVVWDGAAWQDWVGTFLTATLNPFTAQMVLGTTFGPAINKDQSTINVLPDPQVSVTTPTGHRALVQGFVTVSMAAAGKVKAYVARSTDGGATWAYVGGSAPFAEVDVAAGGSATLPVMAVDTVTGSVMYAIGLANPTGLTNSITAVGLSRRLTVTVVRHT